MAAEFTFDFCLETRVAELIAPDEANIKDFNGWAYSPAPVLPFRPSFTVTLEGLRWYLNTGGTALDVATDAEHNAGRLENFYRAHRLHKSFTFNHEYLGDIEARFASPVSVPKAQKDSGGLIEEFTVTIIQDTVAFT